MTPFKDLPLADHDREWDGAAAVVQGSRGGVSLPAKDVDRAESHLAPYDRAMGETPPWDRD